MGAGARATNRLVLASGSPRRRELIRALDHPVEVIRPAEEEDSQPLRGETPQEFVARLALHKAHQVAPVASKAVVIAADTAVVLDGDVLGKPASTAEATQMLERLRGRPHMVVTGVTALDTTSKSQLSVAVSSDVVMRRYSAEEMAAYVASGDPFDKAGGYAVQNETFHPAERVQGCYPNVVGLPLCELIRLLEELGVEARLKREWRPPKECGDCPLRDRQEVSRE